MSTILIEEDTMVPVRDGVKLATDLYRLQGAPPVPMLVIRTPATRNQHLIIGPWSHMNFSGSFPEREFGWDGSAATIDLPGVQRRWFDRWPRGANALHGE